MKKLGIVLVALILVGSGLLAALESPITAELKAGAKTEFTYDLGTKVYGFENTVKADLNLTFLPKQSLKYEGDGQIWGEVKVNDLQLGIKGTAPNTGEVVYNAGVVANIWFEDLLWLSVGRVDFNANTVKGDHDSVKSEAVDGLTFGGQIENVGKIYASAAKSKTARHDWKFMLAFEGAKFADLVTPQLFVTYDLGENNMTAHASVKTEVDVLDGLNVRVAGEAFIHNFDLQTLAFEGGLFTELVLVAVQDNNTAANLDVVYSRTDRRSAEVRKNNPLTDTIHAKLSFTESDGDAGFLPIVGGTLYGGADVVFPWDKATNKMGKTVIEPVYGARLAADVADFSVWVKYDSHVKGVKTNAGEFGVKYTGFDKITLLAKYNVPNVLDFKKNMGVVTASFAVFFMPMCQLMC